MISDGVNTAASGEGVCQLFASYFASVYNDAQPDPNQLIKSFKVKHSDSFTGLEFSREQVLKKLESLVETKGPGSDEIPPLFIKICADVLVDPLVYIYNRSIATGLFSSQWKIAKVVPIPKGGESKLSE